MDSGAARPQLSCGHHPHIPTRWAPIHFFFLTGLLQLTSR